ncbi:hypothetical protein FH972_023159 [Carpinus fangiana]|uniref:Ubiquitin-like domain-containing protein n=1 Tax=Carpinus fangiana TaxID=176857 RepID=A0A5N6KUQ7_9ROSI|nr:hypothetical protein FH972_023159 [Carpinus fangiana]
MSVARRTAPIATTFGLFLRPNASATSSRRLCFQCLRAYKARSHHLWGFETYNRRGLATETAQHRPHSLESHPLPRDASISESSPVGGRLGNDTERSNRSPETSTGISISSSSETKAQSTRSQPAPTGGVGSIAMSEPAPGKSQRKSKLRPRRAAMKLTPAAVEALRELLDQPEPKLIRVGVKNRGCSGLAYHLEYVDKPNTFDEAVDQDGVKVLVDSKALFSIIGSEMDWVEDKLSRRFVFKNPNISEYISASKSRLLPSFANFLPSGAMWLCFEERGASHGSPSDVQHVTLEPARKRWTPNIRCLSSFKCSVVPFSMDKTVSLVVRFATSLPDISLTISSPSTTAVANIKRQIRAHLPNEERKHGLRLIYSGRVLDATLSLTSALGLPKSTSHDANIRLGKDEALAWDSAVTKGKERVPGTDAAPIYIHCAVSSFPLSQGELAEELKPPTVPTSFPSDHKNTTQFRGSTSGGPSTGTSTTTPQGRGFDRLLSSPGFTRADVDELRAQHTAMVANRHTPDTLPSREALLEMEEAWLDAGASESSNGAGAADVTRTAADQDEQSRALADTLYGAMMGFFWPVGALAWGFREDGVWSKRRKEMVLLGLFLNLVFGLMSLLSL